MTAEIRGVDLILFSSSEDEQARSAILLRFPCEQYHKGITIWINNLWKIQHAFLQQTCQNSLQSMFCVGQTRIRNKSQMSRLCGPISRRCHTKLTVPSAAPKQLLRCVNPNQWKTGRSGSNLRLCGENWPISSTFSSLMEMTKVHLSSQCLTPRSQVLSIEDRRHGGRKTCVQTCLLWKWTNIYPCFT